MKNAFLGVDVGTGSVRAVALDEKGLCLGSAAEKLQINHPRQDYYEQSSEQIWEAVCGAVRPVVAEIEKKGYQLKAVGVDATCSLVFLDDKYHPLCVSPPDSKKTARIWDVIMWMDHRAVKQAERINATKHDRLKYAGRQISPEMDAPKLLWVKEHKPEVWGAVGHVMELADFLTFKACGSLVRSQCTVVCKWLFDASPGGRRWDHDFLSAIGLSDLINSPKIGTDIQPPGTFCSSLTQTAASQFGLSSQTEVAVAVGIIDAHAGAMGVLGAIAADHRDLEQLDIEQKLAIIAGTSACHMALSKELQFIDGVWGPYYGVILDKYWLHEAGQNVLGLILDEITAGEGEPDGRSLAEEHSHLQTVLAEQERLLGPLAVAEMAADMHVWPDYRGNRSPKADPHCKGAIAGLRLKSDIGDQFGAKMVSYLAHIQSFAYMTRFIIETIAHYSGPQRKPIAAIYLCGGLQKNPIYVQTHADVCRVPVVTPADSEVVARGAAILGANASGAYTSLEEAMRGLSCSATVAMPRKETYEYHQKKYRAFLLLGQTEDEMRRIMAKNE